MGKSLIRHCMPLKRYDIVILSREPEKRMREHPFRGMESCLHFLRGDIRNFRFPETDFDYIIHGATTSGRIVPDDEMRSVVVDGTRRVLEFASRNNSLSNLLYVSSGAVYGDEHRIPMRESFSCNPVSIYGISKHEAERRCLDSGIPFSIARCFAFVGEYLPLDTHFAIGNFIRDCLREKPITIRGDGTAIRSYLFSADWAHWLWEVLIHGKKGRAYNVGSDHEVSIKRLAEIVRDTAGSRSQIDILSSPSGAPPHRYVPNLTRSRHELGLDVKIPLAKAIRLTLAHHKPATEELET